MDTHNHPGNSPNPSGNGVNNNGWGEIDGNWGDRGHAKGVNEHYSDQFIPYRIYLPKTGSYVYYNEDGKID